MANSNFVVHNGLTVGPTTIDAASGNITVPVAKQLRLGNLLLRDNGDGQLHIRNAEDTIDGVIVATVTSQSQTQGNIQIGGNHIESIDVDGAIVIRPGGAGTAGLFSNVAAFGKGADPFVFTTGAVLDPSLGVNYSASNIFITTGNTLLTSGNVRITMTTAATSTATGAFQVMGGAAVKQDLKIGGNLAVGVDSSAAPGNLRVFYTAAATAATNGALVVDGGLGVGQNSVFGGNVTINGNLFVNGNVVVFNSNSLSINDAMIYLADDNPADLVDIGIVSSFTNATRYQHTGLVRDATDGIWKLFANVVPEPTTTVDFTNANYSSLYVGNIQTVAAATVGSNLNVTGNVLASQARFNYLDVNGNVDLGLANAIAGSWITITGNLTQTTSGGAVYINTSGNILATSGTYNNLVVNTGNVNAVGGYFVGNGYFLTGVVTSLSSLQSGTSNIAILGPGSNITSNVNGTLVTTTATQGFFVNAGNLSVTGGWLNAGTVNASGNVLGAQGVFGYLNSAGNLSVAGTTALFGNTSHGTVGVVSGQFHSFVGNITQTTSGGAVYINTTGNVVAAQGSFGSVNSTGLINTSGNVLATGLTVFGNISVGSAATPGAAHTITGNVSMSGPGTTFFNLAGNLSAAVANVGILNSTGNILAATGVFSGLTVNGVVNSTGNVLATGLSVFGNTAHGVAGAISGQFHSFVGNITQSTSGGAVYFNTTGNISAAVANVGILNSTGNILAAGGVFNALTVNGFINTTSNLSVGGNAFFAGNTTRGTVGAVSGAFHTFVGNINQFTSGGAVYINTTGNISAAVANVGILNSTGNILAAGGVFSGLTVNGFVNATGASNLSVGGAALVAGNLAIGTVGAISGGFHTVRGNIAQTSTGGAVYINTTGNVIATAGTYNNLVVNTGNINAVGGYFVGNGFFLSGVVTSGGGSTPTYSALPPGSPTVGATWIDSDDGAQYVYINDGDSNQWVELGAFSGAQGIQGEQGIQGIQGIQGNATARATNIPYPSNAENITFFYTGIDLPLSRISSVLTGGTTPSVTFSIRYSGVRSAAGTEVVTGGIACNDTGIGIKTTSFNNATIAANSWVWITTTAMTGNPTSLAIALEF